MDTGRAAPQFGLDSKSPKIKARPWALSLATHLVLALIVVLLWQRSRPATSREWRLVSKVDLRSSSSDTLPTSASSTESASPTLPQGAQKASNEAPSGNAQENSDGNQNSNDLIVPYPEVARKRGEQGTVAAEWRVDESGSAQDVQVTHTSGSRVLDEAVMSAIAHHTFLPSLGQQQAQFRFVLSRVGGQTGRQP